MSRRILRSSIALTVAYAIALQALLSGYAAAFAPDATASQVFAICSSSAGAGDTQPPPAEHDTNCPFGMACAMPGCGAATPLHVHDHLAEFGLAAAPAIFPWAYAAVPLPARKGSQAPRAPPMV